MAIYREDNRREDFDNKIIDVRKLAFIINGGL